MFGRYLLLLVFYFVASDSLNTRPIIGILTKPTMTGLMAYGKSYIAASYVKFIESAGARVVPIFHTATQHELSHIFSQVNGILLPGSGVDEDHTPLLDAEKFLFDLTIKGIHFPLQGHCQGFEGLHMVVSQNGTVLSHYNAQNLSLALDLMPNAKQSRLFSSVPPKILDILSTKAVTLNNHRFGVNDGTYEENPQLANFFTVISHNRDKDGNRFISTVEAKNYPIYAYQWHPEKSLFEWNPNEVINHSTDAVKAMQYLADFFVSEAQKNDNKFLTEQEEFDSLIYNYSPMYTAHVNPNFVQCYIWNH